MEYRALNPFGQEGLKPPCNGMADHGMGSCIKKIVLGIPHGSILFKKAKQFFISGNDLPHQQVLGRIISNSPDSLTKPVFVLRSRQLYAPDIFRGWAPRHWAPSQLSRIRFH